MAGKQETIIITISMALAAGAGGLQFTASRRSCLLTKYLGGHLAVSPLQPGAVYGAAQPTLHPAALELSTLTAGLYFQRCFFAMTLLYYLLLLCLQFST